MLIAPSRGKLVRMKPWKALKRSVYEHSPYRKIEDVIFELPDGRQATYSLVHVGKVVCVLAFTKNREVILARQFRPGPNCVLDDLPGGGVDDDEDPAAAIRRELEEETGFVCGAITPLGVFIEDAYSTIERHAFLAFDCEPTGRQKLDTNEFIEVVLKPLPEFVAQLRAGLSTDADVAWAGLLEAGLLNIRD